MKIKNLKKEDIWEYENGFYWFAKNDRLSKLLSRYELYKEITHLTGDIVELGTYKATSLIQFMTFRNLFENDFKRKFIAFDAFGEFPKSNIASQHDIEMIEPIQSAGGDGMTVEELKEIISHKNFDNYEICKGNIFDTLPSYVKKNPQLRIALLHLDLDVYEPTILALQSLVRHLVDGALIVFDDYGKEPGATIAADEFCVEHSLKIHASSHNKQPSYAIWEARRI